MFAAAGRDGVRYCNATLTLVGLENSLTRATLQITSCDVYEQNGLASWFISSLVPENDQFAALSYFKSYVEPVIEGQVQATGKREVGNVIFETKRSRDSKQILEITAIFTE